MTRTTRLVVLVVVGVLGTVESVFWAQAGWRWYQSRYGSSLPVSSLSQADAAAAPQGTAEEN